MPKQQRMQFAKIILIKMENTTIIICEEPAKPSQAKKVITNYLTYRIMWAMRVFPNESVISLSVSRCRRCYCCCSTKIRFTQISLMMKFFHHIRIHDSLREPVEFYQILRCRQFKFLSLYQSFSEHCATYAHPIWLLMQCISYSLFSHVSKMFYLRIFLGPIQIDAFSSPLGQQFLRKIAQRVL